jgi:molybdate/tungstate transport system substrate-binding protein
VLGGIPSIGVTTVTTEATAKSRGHPGRLVIKHAGSLNASFGAVNKEFRRLNPGVELVDEWGGSAGLVRKVIGGAECGVLASADYNLIARWMLPDPADWYIIFASNQFVLRCTEKSKYHEEISERNWHEILQRDGVDFWLPDPDDDPGGYRSLMVLQLAERHYQTTGSYSRIMASETTRLLTAANIHGSNPGYTFAYGSSPCPNGSWNICLPEEINLSNAAYRDFYRQAVVKINGRNPGEKLTLYGEPILFGITIPKACANKDLAVEWIRFLLADDGRTIMKRSGMTLLIPAIARAREKVPEALRSYVGSSE